MSMELDTMAAIMAEKSKEMQQQEPHPLDPEGRYMAEEKRKTFDLPTNAVKVDPLR
jgi:hypothetical protein